MIEHEGIIEKINGNHITVGIFQQSACSACHARGMCMAADSKEKRQTRSNLLLKNKLIRTISLSNTSRRQVSLYYAVASTFSISDIQKTNLFVFCYRENYFVKREQRTNLFELCRAQE
jgi:Positive regulator of sigma(E), RseC/MucC.